MAFLHSAKQFRCNQSQSVVNPDKTTGVEMSDNKMTLREMAPKVASFMQKLYETEGEITEDMAEDLAIKENMLPEKVDAYAFKLDRLESEIKYWKDQKKGFDNIIRSLTRTSDWLKANMKGAMNTLGMSRLEGSIKGFTLSKAKPKLELDEDQVPDTWMKRETVISIDTDRIREALDQGQTLPFARYVDVYTLRKSLAKNRG